jgi:cell division protein FtsN
MTGLFIGLVLGLIVAAGLAWYLNNREPAFKSVGGDETPKVRKEAAKSVERETPVKALPAEAVVSVEAKPKVAPKPVPARTLPPPPALPSPALPTSPTPKPGVDYTFYGILPSKESHKQALPKPIPQQSKDIWWLQVAALKNPADAEKLKAKLSLLGLNVTMQKIESGGVELYRVRVGPYKREDEAFGDLDTLAENNFEPRLFKDPPPPQKQEHP